MALSLFPLFLLKMLSGGRCSREAQEKEKKSHFNNSAPPRKLRSGYWLNKNNTPNLGALGYLALGREKRLPSHQPPEGN